MRTTTFSIRLTPEEIQALKVAAGDGRASVFAREAVLAAVARRRRTRRQGERDMLRRELALIQGRLIALTDGIGLGDPLQAQGAGGSSANAAELENLRLEVQALVKTVLRIGRRVAEAETEAP